MQPNPSVERSLDVYGLRIRLTGWADVVEGICLDFKWFESKCRPGSPDVDLVLNRGMPNYDAFHPVEAAFVTPRNVVYQIGDLTVVDHFGRALSVLNRRTGRMEITGEDELLVYQATYLFLLSRIGEHVDGLGLPRFHALGLVGQQGGVAIVMPSGGGKTTLALRALAADGVRLLSEDAPLLDRRGWLHPFPLRIGIRESHVAQLPQGWKARCVRGGPNAKYAVEVATFADRIETAPTPLRHLVIGHRSLGRNAVLEPAPKRSAVSTLLREDIVGFGFFQGMEFLLRHGVRDVVGRTGVTVMRARCCAAALHNAKVWNVTLGRDLERNWQVLSELLR